VLTGARILLSGATGRLGRRLADEFLRSGCELVLLVRASSPETARERVRAALPSSVDLRRVTAVCGDVTQPELGLRMRERRRLRTSLDFVLHAAATTSFTSSLEIARGTNLIATHHVLAFAERAPRLSRLGHVSTAFVAGRRTGRILETDLAHDRGFQNTYQQSKYEAEQLVRSYADRLPVVVYRPSIVLDGPDAPGRSAFRYAFELVRRGLLPAVPGTAATPVDLVTERDAARAISRLLCASDRNSTYHVAGGDCAPSLGDIVGPFGVSYLSEEQFRWALAKWRHETPRLAAVYDELASFIFELAYPKIFDTSCVEIAIGRSVAEDDPLVSLLGHAEALTESASAGARGS
jgi:nucleoside-diphosphate-sugar epimerase